MIKQERNQHVIFESTEFQNTQEHSSVPTRITAAQFFWILL